MPKYKGITSSLKFTVLSNTEYKFDNNLYGYYKTEDQIGTKIGFKRKGDGVKDKEACKNYDGKASNPDTMSNYGNLDFGTDTNTDVADSTAVVDDPDKKAADIAELMKKEEKII